MDIRDEVAKTCILVKSIPFDTDDKSVWSAVSDETTCRSVCRVFRYTEQADNSTRFIVQLNNQQDADRLIRSNSLCLRNPDNNEGVKVEVGFCPECIVPSEWVEGSPSSDLTEDGDPDKEQSDGPEDRNNTILQSDRPEAQGNRIVQETNGAASSLVIEKSIRMEDVVTKFSELLLFSNEEEQNEKDEGVDEILASSKDTDKKVELCGGATEDTVHPSQKAVEVESTSDPDEDRYSPPQYDTPQADTYEPAGDVYIPAWRMTPAPRPVSVMEPTVTKTPIEKGQRAISCFVDHQKLLTGKDLSGIPENKEKQNEFDNRCDPTIDSVLGGHVSVGTEAVDKGENSPEISRGVGDHGFMKDKFPSEGHVKRVQSINTRLKVQANELESAKLTETAGKEMEKFRQSITENSSSYKQTGEMELESENGEDKQRRILQISSPPVRTVTSPGDTPVRTVTSPGDTPVRTVTSPGDTPVRTVTSPGDTPVRTVTSPGDTQEEANKRPNVEPQVTNTDMISDVSDSKGHRSEEMISQSGVKYTVGEISSNSGSTVSSLLGQGQPLQPSQSHTDQSCQGQLFQPSQPHTSQLGQDQLLQPSQPHTGQLGQGQPLQPSQTHTGQLGQGQPLQPSQTHTGQSGQGQQLSSQSGQGQQVSSQLGQGQLLQPSQPQTGQSGQGQLLQPSQPQTGQSGQGQLLQPSQPHTGQLGQGQPLQPSQTHTGQLGQGQQLSSQSGQGQQLSSQSGQGQQLSSQSGQGQPLQPSQPNIEQSGQGQPLQPSQPHTGQSDQGQFPGQLDPMLQYSNAYSQQMTHQGQQIIYPHQGQSDQSHWPGYDLYPGQQNAAVFYQHQWGPGYPNMNYGTPQYWDPGMTPHLAPHMAPSGPHHQIIPQQYTAPHQVAPPTGTYGVVTNPNFPVAYPSDPASYPSGPSPGVPPRSEDSGTDNIYMVAQEVEKVSPKTSLEMEKDDLRDLEQWAQSPIESGHGQKEAATGETEDYREENLYDSFVSVGGSAPDQISVQKDFGDVRLLNGKLSDAKVDVIVNLTNTDLNLSWGNVSKSILQAAGQELLEECRRTYPRGIKQDMIAVTSGGRLYCQKIFHVIVPRWKDVAKSVYEVLGKVVTTCISMAIRLEMTSIAFPAIGTGKLGYPADLVAKAMLQSTKEFLMTERPSNFLVCYVIYHGGTAVRKAFEDTAMSVLKSNDEEEPMEVDGQDYDDKHTYTEMYPHDQDGEHLYDSLKFSRSGAQQNSSPVSGHSDPYMNMNDFKKPIRKQDEKESTYVDMQKVKKQQAYEDAYVFVPVAKQVRESKDGPIKNTETTKIRHRTSETETEESSPKGSQSAEDLPSPADQPPQYLRVTYPRRFAEDNVRFYFENKKRSGGGNLLKFDHYPEKKVTLIQFEDSEAASRVLAKSHQLEGLEIHVSLVKGEIPSNIEEKKLLISGINPKTTYDTLVNFLEVRAKAVPQDVMYGNRKDRAVVSFESKPDFDFLKEVCQTKRLEGNLLKVSLVPVPTAVLVRDCPDVSEDAIMFFFENEKRSGGGEVEKVEILSNQHECLVHFIDPAVAKRVCDPKQNLQIEKKTVTASLYYPFLRTAESKSPVREPSRGEFSDQKKTGQSGPVREKSDKKSSEQKFPRELPEPPLAITMKLPSPVTLTDIEPRLTEFIMTSEPNKSAFEKMMSKAKGKVIWPKVKTDYIMITCVIDVNSAEKALEAKQWPAEIYKNVKKFFGAMTTEEVPVVKKIWEAVIGELQDMNISYPDGVAVNLNREHFTIVIVGHANYVKDLKKKVEEITSKNEKFLRQETEQVSKSEFLKMFQIQILWKFKFKTEIQKRYPKLEVDIDVDNKKICFSGVLEEVDQARVDMRVKLEALPCQSLAISRGMRDLFFRVPVKTKFVQLLKQRHLVTVWDLPPHQDMCIMYAESNQKAKDAVSLFTQVLREKKIPMGDDLAKVVESTKWQLALQDLFSKYPEEIHISVEEKCVYVTTVSTVFEKVCGCIDAEIKDYKNIHDVHKDFLPVEEGVFRFLEKYKRYDIETCTLAIQKTLNLQLKTRNSKTKPGYELEGTSDALKLARNKLMSVVGQVSMDTHKVRAVGAADYFSSLDGREKIGHIESSSSVIIRKSAEYRGDQEVKVQSSVPVIKAKCQVGQDKQCIVVEGDMTLLTVDVMVNAANTDMMHGGGIAGAISSAGGPVIQNECDDYIRKHGPVPEGKAIISGPGMLPCKIVVHTVGPIWQDGYHGEENKLQAAVYSSLEIVHRQGFSSIALPAISAGIFGYPLRKSVETIISMVQHFFAKQPNTRIKYIYLCDTDQETVKLFIKELVAIYGPQKVTTSDSTAPSSSDEEISDDEMSEEEEEEEEDSDDEDLPRPSSKRNITVQFVRGELAKTKADVLVNSTGRDLLLNVGALSMTLLQHGGPYLQAECTQRYPRGIEPGDVAITTGGNLQCRQVYHGTFNSWGNQQRDCVQSLEKFVSTCLHTADKRRMTSIAFPSLGTGRLGYPPATVAKVMLSCVRTFERDMPNSCLKTVMFVVYPQDRQSVQDFEAAVDRDLRSGGATGFRSNRGAFSNHGALSLGQVDIEIKQGDITKATTPAIVNSTGDHLDLTRGAVSRAILKAGGQKIQVECNARRTDMQSRGLVVTTGGSLMCQYILHVRSCSRQSDWTQAVSTCLREADRLGCGALTFPALGTGQVGCTPQDIADAMFTAIRQVSDQLRHLRKVSLVIYQADMVDIFKSQLKHHTGGADRQTRPKRPKEKEAYKSKSRRPKSKGHRPVTSSYARPDNVQFLLWSDSPANIRNAKSRIDKACDLELQKLTVPQSYKEIIKGLNTYQIGELNGLGSKRNVHLAINQNRGEITLEGRRLSTTELLPEIQNLLRKFEKHKEEVEKAKTVAEYVQWCFDENGKWRKFNAEANMLIEKAYKAREVQTKVSDSSRTYVIDFQKMVEYERSSPNKKFKIERRDLGTRSPGGLQLPTSWTPMGKSTYQLVNLAANDEEYKKTERAFRASAGGKAHTPHQAGLHAFMMQGFMAPSYGYQQVVKIQRVQNKSLYQQYTAKKQELWTRNRKDPETWLWHGTSPDTVNKIAMKGFDRSYCGKNATAYGNGVYFAVNASYSMGYCQQDHSGLKHMFYTQVLTGESCAGHNGMKYLPDRQGSSKGVAIPYDSATNNVSGPSMYIIFHDSQAYPAYLISFR